MTSKRNLLAGTLLLLCVVAGYWLLGRGKYREVSSEAYDFATAIYSTCNRQDATKLSDLEAMLATAESAQKINAYEARTLQEIVEFAQAGDWSTAASEARHLMRDQARFP